MNYRVLARKYRPRTFAEVIGQDHIVRALSRAIEKQRVGQAYMLVGPRGTGKTSTARILAKALNCEQGETVAPCLQCDACHEIEVGTNADVVEIDGASNNGVDDVRALRDRVHYRPLRDRRKVYIIDEVQRLSGPAFDALLKTLEEPPDHALFLFATTDPHKIPDTIVSRCQVFEFRRLREVDIQDKLTKICGWEEVEVEDEILAALARGCRGGLRDAESMLDQVLAVADGAPTLDDLEMIAGLARPERWLDLLEALSRDDAAAILGAVEAFLQRGGTERDLVEQAVDAVRDLLHVALLGEDALGVEPAPERRQRMIALARTLGRDRLESLLGMLFALDARMARAPLAARALLEWTLLRAARLGELVRTAQVLNLAPAGPVGGGAARTPAGQTAPSAATAPTVSAAPAAAAPTAPAAAAPVAPVAPTAPAVPAAAGPAPSEEGSSGIPDFNALLQRVLEGRPSLGKVIEQNLVEGSMGNDGVQVVHHPLTAADQAMVEDPVEQRWLCELDGSPGAWTFRLFQAPQVDDPIGDSLQEGFGGTREVP